MQYQLVDFVRVSTCLFVCLFVYFCWKSWCFAGEPEDDEVAGSVFYLTHKKKAEWRDRTVALTDKTIDIKRSECGVLVVHFLSPCMW